MQEFSQKYTIVCLLEEREEGYEYSSSEWPLHVTLADTFSITTPIEDLIRAITAIAAHTQTFTIEATHIDFFGPSKKIKVAVYERGKPIHELHYAIVEALEKLGVAFNDPQYSKEGFVPHSTAQKHAEVKVGDKVSLNNLAIVDMFPDGDHLMRKIIKIVKLLPNSSM